VSRVVAVDIEEALKLREETRRCLIMSEKLQVGLLGVAPCRRSRVPLQQVAGTTISGARRGGICFAT